MRTLTFLNKSIDPARCPHSYMSDPLLKLLHLLLNLCRQETENCWENQSLWHNPRATWWTSWLGNHLRYLDMFRKKFYCFGSTLEGCELPGDDTGQTATHENKPKKAWGRKFNKDRWRATYLMSSMVRRAELQTMSRTTEPFSVCCFWSLAHLGHTRNNTDKRKWTCVQKWWADRGF